MKEKPFLGLRSISVLRDGRIGAFGEARGIPADISETPGSEGRRNAFALVGSANGRDWWGRVIGSPQEDTLLGAAANADAFTVAVVVNGVAHIGGEDVGREGSWSLVVVWLSSQGNVLQSRLVVQKALGTRPPRGTISMRHDGSALLFVHFAHELRIGGKVLRSSGWARSQCGSVPWLSGKTPDKWYSRPAYDVAAILFSPKGDVLWTWHAGAPNLDEKAVRAEFLDDGEVVLTGTFQGHLRLGSENLRGHFKKERHCRETSSADDDIFVAVLSADGSFQHGWALGDEGRDQAIALVPRLPEQLYLLRVHEDSGKRKRMFVDGFGRSGTRLDSRAFDDAVSLALNDGNLFLGLSAPTPTVQIVPIE